MVRPFRSNIYFPAGTPGPRGVNITGKVNWLKPAKARKKAARKKKAAKKGKKR